jgi:predicted nucleic acid-binding protein
MTFADASFLVAFFAGGEHQTKATEWWVSHNETLVVSRLVLFEAENSIRTLPLSGKVTESAARWGVEMLKRAVLEGLLEVRRLREWRVYPLGQRLSETHAARRSYGAVDLLHVSTAIDLEAEILASFDIKQRELAQAAGLQVCP